MKGVTLAWLTMVGVVTWRFEGQQKGTLPPPRLYTGTAAVYSLLGLVSAAAPGPATLFGWGLIVAALTTGVLLPPAPAKSTGPAATTPGPRPPVRAPAPPRPPYMSSVNAAAGRGA